MIKDIMVHLDGSPEDEIRLEHGQALASADRARLIGLFANQLPDLTIAMPMDGGAAAMQVLTELQDQALKDGDVTARRLTERLASLQVPGELRRLDETFGALPGRVAEQARCADLFIATRCYGAAQSALWPDLVHTMALILTLNRKTHRAYNRVREGNFALEGLLGFDLNGKTAGVVGTGKIGEIVAKILTGFGCTVLAHDVRPNPACEAMGVRYVPMEELFPSCDLITLHCPLTPATHHLINAEAVRRMKPGVMLVNTSRGGVVDTRAVIKGLKDGTIGSLGLDVYEEETDLFFEDLSNRFISDDVFARLLTFPNVLMTGHQAFFTKEALTNIAEATLGNITAFEATGRAVHEVSVERGAGG